MREVSFKMQVFVSQEALAAMLSLVTRAVGSGNINAALGGVLVRAEEGRLLLMATDMEMAIQGEVAATVDAGGTILLSARHLSELVRHFEAGTLELTDDGDGSARVRQGKRNFSLQVMDPESFPELEEEGGAAFILPQRELRRMVRHVQAALSKDTSPSRAVLTGAWYKQSGREIEMISSDGVRVAWAREEMKEELPGERELVLPGRTLQELDRVLSEEGTLRMSVGERMIFVEVGAVTLATRRMEENYPKVKEYLPKEYGVRRVVSRRELEKALERIFLIAREVETSPMDFALEEERVVLQTQTPQVGSGYEEVSAAGDGASTEAKFNTRYLLEGVRVMTGEELQLEATEEGSALCLTPLERPQYKYVVLPMRKERRRT